MIAFWSAGSDSSRTNLITFKKRVLAGTSGLPRLLGELLVRLGEGVDNRSDALFGSRRGGSGQK